MRTYETVKELREVKKLTSLVCDLCHKKSKGLSIYDVEEVTISCRLGDGYPEGGSGTELSFDLCPDCFTDRLVPWMLERGAAPQTREWEY